MWPGVSTVTLYCLVILHAPAIAKTRSTGTVHTSAKTRLIRIATKFNRLLIGPLPTFPENFMKIRLDVVAKSC